MCDLCTLKCDMYMKKQERKEKKKIPALPTALAVGKAGHHSLQNQVCRPPSWQSAKPLPTARRKAVGKAFFDCQEKSSRCRLLFSWQSGKPLPTAFLLAVGKAFADCQEGGRQRRRDGTATESLPTGYTAVGEAFTDCCPEGSRKRILSRHLLSRHPFADCLGEKRSAKPLPTVFQPLPTAFGSRQRGRFL